MLNLPNGLKLRTGTFATVNAVSVAILFCLLAGAAHASNGEGSFSIRVSTSTEFLDITAVDAGTLLPLSSIFHANDAGEYAAAGLFVLDGDTDNPVGDFEVTGLGDPHLQTQVTFNLERLIFTPGEPSTDFVLFISLIAAIEIKDASDEPVEGPEFRIQTVQTTTTTSDGRTPSEPLFHHTNVFLDTSTGEEVRADGASTSGPINVPGTITNDSGLAPLPSFPDGSAATSFDVLVAQVDFALFDLEDTSIQLTSVSRTEIFKATVVPLPPALLLFASAVVVLWQRSRGISVSH